MSLGDMNYGFILFFYIEYVTLFNFINIDF